MIIPLLERLQQQEVHKCVTLALTTAAHTLAQHGFASRGFASLLTQVDGRAIEWGERLASNLPPGGVVSREESVAYLGLSYVDLEERVGKEQAAKNYSREGRQAFLPVGPISRLFDEVAPDVVISTISPRAEQAALMVARERGIPSLCLIDLFGEPSLFRAQETGYGMRVCVISEAARQWLIDKGREEGEVVVTGNPAFDSLGNPELSVRAAQLRHDRGWGESRVILWASQREPEHNPITGEAGNPELPQHIERVLLEIVSRHPEWRLVVRPHPNEPAREHLQQERVELSGPQDHLHTLLAAVDVVVVMTSTVGLEARLIGKPLVSVDKSVLSVGTPYASAGLSHGVHELDQLEAALEDALRDGESIPNGFHTPGGATEAVVAQIDELAGSGVV
jgi:hypothetical protein